MEIKAEITNIENLLIGNKKFYQIPDYQRPYAWSKDNVSVLIDDLVSAYLENKEKTYFCGSMVLVNNASDRRFDIIDGQQRTTTFIIMSCVFRDVYASELSAEAKDYIKVSIQDRYDKDKKKLRFLTDEQYQIDFKETVLKGIDFKPTKRIEKAFPDNKYLQNAYYIREFLAERVKDEKIDVNDFVIWFFEKVELAVITCPSEDSAIQIFSVLNDRGMQLGPEDILKAELMRKLDKKDRTAFKSKWEKINIKLKSADLDLNQMLTTYSNYKRPDNHRIRFDKNLIKAFDIEGKNAQEIITEIYNFSEAYTETLAEENKYRYCLKYLRHRMYWEGILSTASFVKYPEIEALKKILVAYYYQNWIAGGTVARFAHTSFNVILKQVKNLYSIDNIKKSMRENLNKYQTTEAFREAFEGENWVSNTMRDKAILLLLEYFSTDDSKQNFIPLNNKLHIEHILPQTPNADWKDIFTEKEREKWTNSLANLTLLSGKKNTQAQNYSFDKKKKVYENANGITTSFLITQEVVKSEKWDVEALENRQKSLNSKIMEILDIF